MRRLLRPRILDACFAFLRKRLSDKEMFYYFSKYCYQILKYDYYSPVPDDQDLSHLQNTQLIGVNLNEAAALTLIEEIVKPYKTEFNAFPVDTTSDAQPFKLLNGTFMAIDGNIYYGLIRHYQPHRIVEVGSGNSTLLAAAAIRLNVAQGKRKSELIAIEPYPPAVLNGLSELTQLVQKRVQDVPLTFFEELQSGDILFLDSTHILRSGGDIWWEYCEILPRLKPGVLVHIHDVALPEPYPRVYIDQGWYWNEQWLLQSFLTFNDHYEVLWPGNYLMVHYPDKMKAAFSPEYDQMRTKFPLSGPASFWMRVKATAS